MSIQFNTEVAQWILEFAPFTRRYPCRFSAKVISAAARRWGAHFAHEVHESNGRSYPCPNMQVEALGSYDEYAYGLTIQFYPSNGQSQYNVRDLVDTHIIQDAKWKPRYWSLANPA